MENSNLLIRYASDILQEANIEKDKWAVGGGTVLSEIFQHRLSKDIDIFVDDIQLLSSVSPKINDVSSEALHYNEGAQFVSLTFPEGKVDFIASPPVTSFQATYKDFCGIDVYVEDPVEIVSKKVFYRGNFAVPRDLFDLAVVYKSNRRNDLISALKGMPDKVEALSKGVCHRLDDGNFKLYSIGYQNKLLSKGKNLVDKELNICSELFCKVNRDFRIKIPDQR